MKKSCFIIVGEEKVPLESNIVLGNEDGADYKVKNSTIPPFSLKFSYSNGSATVFCTKFEGDCKLGSQDLEMGKMYILEEGDEISLGILTFRLALEGSDESDEELPEEELEVDDIEDEAREPPSEEKELEEPPSEEKEAQKPERVGREPEEQEFEMETEKSIELMIKRDSARAQIKDLLDKQNKEKGDTGNEIEEKKKKKENSKAKKISKAAFPGFWTRFISWLTSIYCVVILDLYILDLLAVKPLLEKFVEHWGSIFFEFLYKEIVTVLQTQVPNASFIIEYYGQLKTKILAGEFFFFDIIRFILIYCSFDLTSHILLGTSLPLSLCGVNSQDHFLVKRIRAFFRSIIGWFTLIPLVYDAPVLTGRRSFKEFITGTHLYFSNKELRYLSTLFLLPLFLLGAPAFQFLLHFEELQEPVEFNEQKIDSLTSELDTEQGMSAALGLAKKINTNKEVLLIPTFKVEKGKNIVKMIFYHFDSNTEITLSLKKEKIDLSSSLKKIVGEDYLIKYLSPDFYHSWNSSKKISDEWNRIIFSSMVISFQEILEFIKKRGIFCTPYLELKKSILSSLLIGKVEGYTWIYSEDRETMEIKVDKKISYVVPLNGTKLSAYRLVTTGGIKGKFYRNIVKHLHLNYVPLDAPSKKSSLENPYEILDFFQYLPDALDENQLDKIVDFFKLLGAKAVMKNDDKLIQIVLRELRALDRELKNLPFFQKLNISLNRIQKAVELKEYEFFNDPR